MATQLTNDVMAVPGDLSLNTATAQTVLGAKCVSPDGRVFRYAKAGATALVPGTLLQAAAEITNHQDVVPAAAAIGATSVTVTLGATAATANYYAGGYLIVTVTPGQGYQYLIKSHPAADASATLTLTLEDPLKVAVTTASNVDLVPNQYSGVIINPTTATSNPVGVAVYPVTALYYGWIQTGGVATILNDGGSTVGTNVSASNGTAGAVEAAVTAQAAIGVAVTGAATTEYGSVKMFLE
jgi:hypothetical protein